MEATYLAPLGILLRDQTYTFPTGFPPYHWRLLKKDTATQCLYIQNSNNQDNNHAQYYLFTTDSEQGQQKTGLQLDLKHQQVKLLEAGIFFLPPSPEADTWEPWKNYSRGQGIYTNEKPHNMFHSSISIDARVSANRETSIVFFCTILPLVFHS